MRSPPLPYAPRFLRGGWEAEDSVFLSPGEARGLFHAWDLADSHRREKAFEISLRIGRAFMASAFSGGFPPGKGEKALFVKYRSPGYSCPQAMGRSRICLC